MARHKGLIGSWKVQLTPPPLRMWQGAATSIAFVVALSGVCWAVQELGVPVLGARGSDAASFVWLGAFLVLFAFMWWRDRKQKAAARLELYAHRIVCGKRVFDLEDLRLELGRWMKYEVPSHGGGEDPDIAHLVSNIPLGVVAHLRSGEKMLRIGGHDHALADAFTATQPDSHGSDVVDGYLDEDDFGDFVDALCELQHTEAAYRRAEKSPLWHPSQGTRGAAFELKDYRLAIDESAVALLDRRSGGTLVRAGRSQVTLVRRTMSFQQEEGLVLCPVVVLRFPNEHVICLTVYETRFTWHHPAERCGDEEYNGPDWHELGPPDWRKLLAALAIDRAWQ